MAFVVFVMLSVAAVAQQPTSAWHTARATELLQSGQAQPAVDEYGEAIRLRLDNPDAWMGRGRAYVALGRFSAAIDDFDQAIRLDPTPAAPYVERGNAYGQTGDFAKAVQDFD